MRSPKECFLTSGHSSEFGRLVSSEAFEPACQYALLQLQSEMPPTCVPGVATDPYMSMDANSQMFGAKRVLQILSSMHQPVQEKPKLKKDTLNYG